MQLSTTFRHMDASQAVREYAAEKLDKIKKYFNKDPISAHAVFAVERGFNHVADINITLPNGIVINAKEVTEDMYSSIDLAAARIERQVRKWKEKIRDHKPHGGPGTEFREVVIPAEELEPQPGGGDESRGKTGRAAKEPTPSPGFSVVKDETFSARSMMVEDAVMQLNLLGDELIVFTDAGTQCISILYRRKDGNYGLIETGRSGPPAA
ncbi:MAG TPA: ribosome-associated translation inhibitor RaiA [Polyangia bacterium]|jgi:putative sigma-54 modulation protein|nr:ribosome-associated translation inhibitor RaiA [Polyangia bacterium]